MEIDLGAVEINKPVDNAAELFTLPTYLSNRTVNICDPAFQLMPGGTPVPTPVVPPPVMPDYPRMTSHGYNRLPH